MFGRDEKVSAIRLTAAQYIILGIFLILAYGLWRLQVMQSDYYSLAAEKNRIRNVPVLAPRGKILDREGRTIVDNYPSFSALLLRDSSRDLMADADLIAQGLHLDPNEVKARIRRFSSMPQYQPISLKEDITPDELQFIEAHRNELPELDTIMAHRRLYPRNGFMAHLIGYVGEVSEEMLNRPRFELYNPGDVVGQSGVELEYNSILMGQNGSKQVVVNSKGKEVGQLAEKPADPGKPLKLTIDIDGEFQRFAGIRRFFRQLPYLFAFAVHHHLLRSILPHQNRVIFQFHAGLPHHIAGIVEFKARAVQHLFADFPYIPDQVRHEPVARIEAAMRHNRIQLRKFVMVGIDKSQFVGGDVIFQVDGLVLRGGGEFLDSVSHFF